MVFAFRTLNKILMKNIISIILAAFLLFSIIGCKKNNEKRATNLKQEQSNALKIDSVFVSDSLVINQLLSLKYSSKMLVFSSDLKTSLRDSIYFGHKEISDFSKNGLEVFQQNQRNKFLSDSKNSSKNNLDDVKSEQLWFSENRMSLHSLQNDYLQIQYLYSSYEGGAHGNYGYSERVFDLKNNKKITLKDITSMPKARLEALLKKNIDRNMSKSKNSEGQIKNSDMILVDVIPASQNFYFDTENLYFHYNPYEIAAYAAGDIIIPVSWKELKGTLNKDFAERMKIK